jgi:hypothetical protein
VCAIDDEGYATDALLYKLEAGLKDMAGDVLEDFWSDSCPQLNHIEDVRLAHQFRN